MDYVPVVGVVAAIAVVAMPILMLRKRQYYITFAQTGVGADFKGTVVIIDDQSYDRHGASFCWGSGSRHTFEFKSPIVVSRGKQYVKQYVLTSTTGLATHQNGVLTVSMPSTVIGHYEPVYKMGASIPRMMNHRLRFAKGV